MAQTPKLGGLYGSLSKGHLGVRVPSTLKPLYHPVPTKTPMDS